MIATAPTWFDVAPPAFVPSRYDRHIVRTLSSMHGQYNDREAFERMLQRDDTPLYEVYELYRDEQVGDLNYGVSILHPGRVGDEYFMTKGHFHRVLDTGEVYHCQKGQGFMVMETPEGDCAVEELRPGRVLYVLPRWAHRSVNTSPDEDLVTVFVYPGNAGHDYGTIERNGFRKLVVERAGAPAIIDNPRWSVR